MPYKYTIRVKPEHIECVTIGPGQSELSGAASDTPRAALASLMAALIERDLFTTGDLELWMACCIGEEYELIAE